MKSDIPGQKRKKEKKSTVNVGWIVTIVALTVVISGVFSLISNVLLGDAGMGAAFLILMTIVLIGILFDVIGVAVTAADTKPFHSMAAHRVHGAQEALTMLRNAEKVSSFCNDVVGDICGIISGTASASIVLLIVTGQVELGTWRGVLEIVLAAMVSGLTVGGKAVGKSLAMKKSTDIVHLAALVVYYIKALPKMVVKIFRKNK